jgi:carbonyl reductase 1
MGERRQRAIVTGANRGIGLEICRRLRDAGMEVVATARDDKSGGAAAEKLGVLFHRLDVEAPDADVEDLLAAHPGGFDALVNNAGVALDGFDIDVVRKTLSVNFHGAMRVTDALLPSLRDGARIVMLSSGLGELSSVGPSLAARFSDDALDRAGLLALVESFEHEVAKGTHRARGWPSSAYAVSKVALNALTRVLARELAADPRKIRVSSACPGWVATDMGGPSAPKTPSEGADTPAWLALGGAGQTTGAFFRDRRVIPF